MGASTRAVYLPLINQRVINTRVEDCAGSYTGGLRAWVMGVVAGGARTASCSSISPEKLCARQVLSFTKCSRRFHTWINWWEIMPCAARACWHSWHRFQPLPDDHEILKWETYPAHISDEKTVKLPDWLRSDIARNTLPPS